MMSARTALGSLVVSACLVAVAPGASTPVAAAHPADAESLEDTGDTRDLHDGARTDAGDDASDDGGDPLRDVPASAQAPGVQVVGPPIADVLAAGYATAGLAGSPARSWTRRARLGGLVPWLSVRTGRNTRWQEVEPDIDHGITLEVRATWRLDRLVFDGRELQAASIDAARSRERRRLATRMIRLYFVWQRATAASLARPRWQSRPAEAAAELDALTDGWFTDELARRLPRRRR